ncbi:MAG: hypothetical protein V7K64_23560 [Nostoc sp.]
MPQATGRLSLYRHLGMEFPVTFDESHTDKNMRRGFVAPNRREI